ncbi:ribosomal-protein-serine N-acetyltransferase [Cunninghamella echinulata]|nr:ribosomal-protein-serine N-acetyltransferase [Cunninghamella echinulata]
MLQIKIDDDVSLRLFHINDVDELHSLIVESQDSLRPWLNWVDVNVRDKSNVERFIKSGLEKFASSGGYPESFAIIYKNQLAGSISYNEFIQENHCFSIGYWLATKYHGKGVMTKSVKALIDMAFNEFSMNRAEIRAAPANSKSRAVPERLGFTQEGVIRQFEYVNGYYLDHVVYGLLKSDLEKK